MPYGVDPVPKHRESGELAQTGANLGVRIRTRIRRSRLDSQLAYGADSAANAELILRAAQLQSTAERARIANALVETLGDARRGEPMTSGRARSARRSATLPTTSSRWCCASEAPGQSTSGA